MAIQREQVVQTAEKYVSRGKIEPAIREYRKLLADNPNDINTLNRIGDLYARIQRIDEAVDFFTQIAEQYADEGFFVKAIAIYKKIIKLDPTRLEVYEKLAELYHRQGLVNEARTQYQVLADYYQKHDNAASAIAIYQKMADLEPNNPSYHVKLAEIYQSQQLIEKAMNEYRVIAEMMIAHGRAQDAAQVYERALDIDASSLGFINDAVFKLKEAGATAAAARFLSIAAERNPQAARIGRLARMEETAVGQPQVYRPTPPPMAPVQPVQQMPPCSSAAAPARPAAVQPPPPAAAPPRAPEPRFTPPPPPAAVAPPVSAPPATEDDFESIPFGGGFAEMRWGDEDMAAAVQAAEAATALPSRSEVFPEPPPEAPAAVGSTRSSSTSTRSSSSTWTATTSRRASSSRRRTCCRAPAAACGSAWARGEESAAAVEEEPAPALQETTIDLGDSAAAAPPLYGLEAFDAGDLPPLEGDEIVLDLDADLPPLDCLDLGGRAGAAPASSPPRGVAPPTGGIDHDLLERTAAEVQAGGAGPRRGSGQRGRGAGQVRPRGQSHGAAATRRCGSGRRTSAPMPRGSRSSSTRGGSTGWSSWPTPSPGPRPRPTTRCVWPKMRRQLMEAGSASTASACVADPHTAAVAPPPPRVAAPAAPEPDFDLDLDLSDLATLSPAPEASLPSPLPAPPARRPASRRAAGRACRLPRRASARPGSIDRELQGCSRPRPSVRPRRARPPLPPPRRRPSRGRPCARGRGAAGPVRAAASGSDRPGRRSSIRWRSAR